MGEENQSENGAEQTEVKQAEPTFAEAKGSEANQHAKKLAKAKSKKTDSNAAVFYTAKGDKVLKLIMKPGKVFSVYIGNKSAKRHGDMLKPLIEGWKKEKIWLEAHEVEPKTKEILEGYEKSPKGKKA